jgi:hypothetical protein
MVLIRTLLLLLVAALAWASRGHAQDVTAGAPSPCDAAAAQAEAKHHLPAGLLAAIGRVESGRADEAGHVAPWPWTIDADGAGAFLPSAAAAADAVRALRAQGRRNIDVGCFQVNLLHHPDAFASLDAAFDPPTNADYAAGFLAGLRQRLGGWPAAVAAYHSQLAAPGEAYRRLVFARWDGAADAGGAARDTGRYGLVVIAGVRIWSPEAPGRAPGVIHIAAAETAPEARLEK